MNSIYIYTDSIYHTFYAILILRESDYIFSWLIVLHKNLLVIIELPHYIIFYYIYSETINNVCDS